MGSPMIEAFDKPPEKEPKKKPLSWPEPGSRHEFDYDDDIVEYKEEEPEEDETSKLPVDEVLKVKVSVKYPGLFYLLVIEFHNFASINNVSPS